MITSYVKPNEKIYLLSLLFSAAFACVPLPSAAQHLSEAAVVDKMYEAFALEKSKKNAEALKAFLEVGRNTVQQRSEAERQTYVISQTMACSCYRKLERYEEGYLLAKKLLQGRLTEKERTEIGALYAYNGYLYASRYMKKPARTIPGRVAFSRKWHRMPMPPWRNISCPKSLCCIILKARNTKSSRNTAKRWHATGRPLRASRKRQEERRHLLPEEYGQLFGIYRRFHGRCR